MLSKCYIAQQYSPRSSVSDISVLCIDEAQDISPLEYSLLKSNHSRSVIWNLYGDINQNISDYKGLYSWKDLQVFDNDNFQIFNLNQNYRNSYEISEFTNKTLNSNMVSLGLMGPPVVSTDWKNSKSEIIQELSSHNNEILLFKSNPENELLLKNIDKKFIREIHEVKGMEYRKVFVLQNGMTSRELYLAYTRAMESLIILT